MANHSGYTSSEGNLASSGTSGGESNLMRLLNDDKTVISDSRKGTKTIYFDRSKDGSREPTTSPPVADKSYVAEDIDEELDFWETMRSITQPKPHNHDTKPVSQHHPLHYERPSTYGLNSTYLPSDQFTETRTAQASRSSGPGASSEVREATLNYGGEFYVDQEEDDEMESYASQYGPYYNIFARISLNKGTGSAHSSPDGSSSSSGGSASYAALPCNPS